MALELEGELLEIMTEVRDRMKAGIGSDYICIQAHKVIAERYGVQDVVNSNDLPAKAQLTFREIESAILHSIEGNYSVGEYLRQLETSNGKLNVGSFAVIYDEIAPLARLAWLDRMIEIEVIA
jgi:hypothetical protein